MAATALAVAALSVAGTLLTREEAEEWSPVWSAHRHLQPQSLRARGAKAALALLAATGGQASKLMTRWPSLLRPRAGQRRAQKRHGTRFRSAKPTLTFGFRVSGFDRPWGSYSLQSRFRVSGFGFRVSGFGFRSVLGKVSLQSRFRVSGFAGRNQLCRPLSGSRL